MEKLVFRRFLRRYRLLSFKNCRRKLWKTESRPFWNKAESANMREFKTKNFTPSFWFTVFSLLTSLERWKMEWARERCVHLISQKILSCIRDAEEKSHRGSWKLFCLWRKTGAYLTSYMQDLECLRNYSVHLFPEVVLQKRGFTQQNGDCVIIIFTKKVECHLGRLEQ